ncbi:hypothetical protein FMM05_03445 [Flavobacterium zepuense]|uniref:Uncharacterized protein n=1 Tax=Flavobacterium zepuense TaxID=2593302 RepID=A0A552V7J9_9FLAO|nr:zinc ribbon domain-containing protein [Flavobacterium zepuense]TRW26447.1 hypothetical protein FMM05_03445 [Flavobacterium zepuense]
MNTELQKLVEYALVDGYITDKEREVLRKKAQNLGFDLDELDMILDGKLYELNKSSKPKVNKCPSCGEILSGLSRVCPSCDYVLYAESTENIQTLDEMMRSLDGSVSALQAVPKTGNSKIFNSAILIVVTAGLYIIYKKVIKKEALFDRYAYINEKIIASTDSQVRNLRTKYGDDQNVNQYINERIAERDAVIAKRQKGDTVSGIITVVAIVGILFAFSKMEMPKPSKPVESAEDKTERYIKAGRIGQAKIALAEMEEGYQKDELDNLLRDLEIDSLTNAEDYDGALNVIRAGHIGAYIPYEIQDKSDIVIEQQINSLLLKAEFDKARERVVLASYVKQGELNLLIDKRESAYKNLQEQNKPTKRKKSRR